MAIDEWVLKETAQTVRDSKEAIEVMNFACRRKVKTLNKRWLITCLACSLVSASLTSFFLLQKKEDKKLVMETKNYVVGKIAKEVPAEKKDKPIFKTPYKNIDKKIEKKAKEKGLAASFIIAQARLESGNYKKIKGNNLFNIKGIGQKFKTHEFYNGKKVFITDSFRKYSSIDESIDDYIRFLKDRYPVAYKGLKLKDKEIFLSGLMDGRYGKYATDPKYKQKVNHLIERYS